MNKFEFIPLKLSHNPMPKFSTQRGKDWISYGSDNMFPNKLIEYYNSSNVHSSIVKNKRDITLGKGIVVNQDNSELVEFFNSIHSEMNINHLLKKMILDVILFDTISLQAVWSNDGESIAKLHHLDFTKVRSGDLNELTDTVEEYWISRDWKNLRKNKPTSFPALNADLALSNPTQIIYQYTTQPGIEYYPLPDYFAAINYISLESELSNYYNKFVNNGLSANLVITMFGDPSPKERQEIRKQIEAKMQGSDNAGNFFLAIVESPEVAPTIQPLSTADNTKVFDTLQNLTFNQIMGAHRVTIPELVGLPSAGGADLGGDANKISVAYKYFESTAAVPIRKRIEEFFSHILQINGIQFEESDFFFQSNLPIEDIDNQIMTINERRAVKGLEPLPNMDVIMSKDETKLLNE